MWRSDHFRSKMVTFPLLSSQNRKIFFENTSFSPKNGLTQGAPLSCSLFVIVFHYNPSQPASPDSKIKAYFFADDLSLYHAAKTLQQLKDIVSATISEFKNWCKNNDMILNSKKSKILWFCASEPIVAEDIESAKSVRVLGVQFDKNLTFAEHVSNIVDYCKKFRSPLYYLVKMGLNDHLSRQFVLGVRSKFCFGLYWHAKIAATHQKTLETWWCNLLRTWLGAKRRLSREYVFEAAGLPKIRDFTAYLLVKRSSSQKAKNLEFYPIPSIPNSIIIINRSRRRSHTFDRNVRPGTISQTQCVDFQVWQQQHGSATAWLTSILKDNQKLQTFLKNSTDWPDSYVRKQLSARSEKLKNLRSKPERALFFEEKTPAV